MYISFLNQNNGEGQRISGINVMRLNFDFLIREFIHHREKRLVECLRMKSAATSQGSTINGSLSTKGLRNKFIIDAIPQRDTFYFVPRSEVVKSDQSPGAANALFILYFFFFFMGVKTVR